MESNNLGYVSLGAGLAIWLLYLLNCVTFGMLSFLLLPLILVCSALSVITGLLGLKQASALGGLGRGPALAGLAVTGIYWLITLLTIGVAVILGGSVVILQILTGG